MRPIATQLFRLGLTGAVTVGLLTGPPALATPGPDGEWSEIPPPMRAYHCAVYDPVGDRMIVYGGGRQQVWELRLGTMNEWRPLAVSGTPPAARTQASAIYDPIRRRMIVFGGKVTTPRNDVWALSLSGTPTWTQLAPSGTRPSVRYGHTAIYDPLRDRMVVFGGTSPPGGTLFNETWALSLSDPMTWTKLLPSGGPPPARQAHSAIYDPRRDRMVVFGGGTSTLASMDDVWALSFGTNQWDLLSDNSFFTSHRFGHTAFYDAARDWMIIVGGHTDEYSDGGSDLDDLPAFDLSGSNAWMGWVPWDGGSRGPGAFHAGAYDTLRHRFLIQGGMWNYSPERNVFAATADTLIDLHTNGVEPPLATDHRAIYDPVRNQVVEFGGVDAFGWGVTPETVRELGLDPPASWAYRLPPGRQGQDGMSLNSAIYDPVRERMLVFGGQTYQLENRTWALSLSGTEVWSELIPAGTPPAPRCGHSAIYDPISDEMLVFGGLTAAGAVSELWSLGLTDPASWTPLQPAGIGPPAMYGHASVYDPPRHRMLVVSTAGVWAIGLDGPLEWSQLFPTGSPPSGALGDQAVYDPAFNRILGWNTNAVWALELSDPPNWRQLTPGGEAPTSRTNAAITYDTRLSCLVLQGGWLRDGHSLPASAYYPDTWMLQFGDPRLISVPPAVSERAVGLPYPSPAREGARIQYSVPRPTAVSARVFDVSGRMTRELVKERVIAGPHTLFWDGMDQSGRRAAPGLYFIHLRLNDDTVVRRLVVLR